MTPTAAIQAVRAIYAELASIPLQRSCTGLAECCRFRLTGRTPYLTLGESLVAANAWRAAGRTSITPPSDGACPFLGTHGRCLIYDGRPFGCRTHFCEAAGGPYRRSDVRNLIRQLEDIDTQMGGCGAMNLLSSLQYTLAAAR